MDIQLFAFNVATSTRKIRDASLPFHQAFTKATPEQQADLRSRWLVGHMMGSLKVSEPTARAIGLKSRNDRSIEQQRAYDRARQDFKYHVVRESGNATRGKTDPVAALLRGFNNLTAAQKRKFLASI